MSNEGIYIKRAQELIEGIERGDFSNIARLPESYRYGHLRALLYVADHLDNGRKLYEQVYDRVMEYGKYHLHEKIKKQQKIKVAFLVISAAEWAAEQVYQRLSQDEHLECYVVVCPLLDREKESRMKIEEQSYRYFENNGYDVRRVYDSEQDNSKGWEDIGGIADIVVHLTPYYQALPEQFQIEQFPLSVINGYIPYGMYVANSYYGTYIEYGVYNKEFVNMQWRVYADSNLNWLGYQKYGLLNAKNVLYSGYVKMDYFFEQRNFSMDEIGQIWKSPAQADHLKMKRLIIAPHHTVEENAIVQYSTFVKNAYFWLYLAQKYRDKITFIFKPHPNLRDKTIQARFFHSFEEYDAYLEMCNALPNAKVVEEESYLDIFATSDGMIMDSASFIGEYLYVNKPLLFLTREEQRFNSLGEKILPCYYAAKGENYIAIEQFIENVILQGDDTMEKQRTQVFEEVLDYVTINGCTASECICRDILGLFNE